MSAVLHCLKPGDHVVCCDDVYGGTQRYMRNFSILKFGLKIDFVDLTDLKLVEESINSDTKLVWIETPTNPTLKVCDIEEIVKITRKKRQNDCWVLSDNTFQTPYLQ
jgi:cystathionine gamma-lyase